MWLVLAAWVQGLWPAIVVAFFVGAISVILASKRAGNVSIAAAAVAFLVLALSWLLAGNSVITALGCLTAAVVAAHAALQAPPGNRRGVGRDLIRQWPSLALWPLLLMLVFYAARTHAGVYVVDPLHPMYEHSIGNSFSFNILAAPDLSIAGKTVKFHFLATQIARLFERMGFDTITSVFFIVPSIVAALLFWTLSFLFSDRARFSLLPVSLFLPLLVWGYAPISMFDKFFARPPTSAIGLIFLVALVYAFEERREALVLFLILAVLLAKISFLFVFVGALVLCVHFVPLERKRALSWALASIAAVGISWRPFFKGAHMHNLWLIGPSPLYEAFMHGQHEDRIEVMVFPLTLFVVLCAAVVVGIKRSNRRGMFEAMALSGIIGVLLIWEATESNSYQFLFASFPFICLLAKNATRPRAAIALMAVLSAYGFAISSRRFVSVADAFIAARTGAAAAAVPDFSSDQIEAWSFVRDHAPANAVLFIPKHYEMAAGASSSWPATGFFRSGLSAHQLYLENEKYKGVIMDDRFANLFASGIVWYEQSVIASPASKARLDSMLVYSTSFANDTKPRVFSPSSPELLRRAIYYAGFGKEWSYLNILPSRYNAISARIAQLRRERVVLPSYVTHIVLEYGDRMAPNAESGWKEIFANGTVRILERGH